MGNGAPYPRSDRSFGSSARTSGFSSPLAGAQATRRHADVALPLTKPDGVSIGVFGHAGAGKSALVNAVRGVSPTSPTAATVGVGTGAESCEQFKWSEVPGVTFYDIPSRTDVPVDDYLAALRLFDLVVLVVAQPYLQGSDHQMVRSLRQARIPHLLVMNKVDEAITSGQEDHGHSAEHTMKVLRSHLTREYEATAGKRRGVKVYLACSRVSQRDGFDMAALRHTIASTTRLPLMPAGRTRNDARSDAVPTPPALGTVAPRPRFGTNGHVRGGDPSQAPPADVAMELCEAYDGKSTAHGEAPLTTVMHQALGPGSAADYGRGASSGASSVLARTLVGGHAVHAAPQCSVLADCKADQVTIEPVLRHAVAQVHASTFDTRAIGDGYTTFGSPFRLLCARSSPTVPHDLFHTWRKLLCKYSNDGTSHAVIVITDSGASESDRERIRANAQRYFNIATGQPEGTPVGKPGPYIRGPREPLEAFLQRVYRTSAGSHT